MTRGLQTVTNVCNKYSRLVMTYPCPLWFSTRFHQVFYTLLRVPGRGNVCHYNHAILHTVAESRQRKCLPLQPCNFTHRSGVQAEEISAHYNHAILHTVAGSRQRICLLTTTIQFYTLLRGPRQRRCLSNATSVQDPDP